MRMSSGASTAYEKPRSGRSICIDETPRSSRIASARTPFSASRRSTSENSPWWRRVFARVSRRNRSKYGATVGSRSIAISFPSPRSRAASRDAWPPAPKVASTTVSPGRTSSSETTSSARTGTWSESVGKTLGSIFRSPFLLVRLRPPPLAVPDLEVVVDPRHDDVPLDRGVLEQAGRDHEPPLPVELAGRGEGEEVALHETGALRELVEVLDPLGEPLPLGARPGVEAAVQAPRDDDPVLERPAQLGREGEAVLLVEGVLMFAEQHGPLRPTVPHFPPPVNPLGYMNPEPSSPGTARSSGRVTNRLLGSCD